MDVQNQHRHIATLQRGWAASADRDRKYNLIRAAIETRAGNISLARSYAQEARWDAYWRDRRLRIARKNSK